MKYGAQEPKQEMETQDPYESCANSIKHLFGDELTPEKISHYVQSADGNLHVAINQILNDLEKQKKTSSTIDSIDLTLKRAFSGVFNTSLGENIL
jgi:hypothetical protein